MMNLKSLLFSKPRILLTLSCLILSATLWSSQDHLLFAKAAHLSAPFLPPLRPTLDLREVIQPVLGLSMGSTGCWRSSHPLAKPKALPQDPLLLSSGQSLEDPVSMGYPDFSKISNYDQSFSLCFRSSPPLAYSRAWFQSSFFSLISSYSSSLLGHSMQHMNIFLLFIFSFINSLIIEKKNSFSQTHFSLQLLPRFSPSLQSKTLWKGAYRSV